MKLLFQLESLEQLSTLTKTRSRGPSGRRLPSVRRSKIKGGNEAGNNLEKNVVGIGMDYENNNNIVPEREDDTIVNTMAKSFTDRIWNICQII